MLKTNKILKTEGSLMAFQLDVLYQVTSSPYQYVSQIGNPPIFPLDGIPLGILTFVHFNLFSYFVFQFAIKMRKFHKDECTGET